jgi:hypothetical protein
VPSGLRPGFSRKLARYLERRHNIGMLGNAPWPQPRGTAVPPAVTALKEIDLWRPLLRRFPDGESKFVHWTFWPATVFTAAARDLTRLFAEDRQLRDILSCSAIWANRSCAPARLRRARTAIERLYPHPLHQRLHVTTADPASLGHQPAPQHPRRGSGVCGHPALPRRLPQIAERRRQSRKAARGSVVAYAAHDARHRSVAHNFPAFEAWCRRVHWWHFTTTPITSRACAPLVDELLAEGDWQEASQAGSMKLLRRLKGGELRQFVGTVKTSDRCTAPAGAI